MTQQEAEPSRPPFLPVPDGVIEITGLPVSGGVVSTTDGSVAMFHSVGGPTPGLARRLSTDAGRTWSEPQPVRGLPAGQVGACGVIRLQSGALAAYHGTPQQGWFLSTSADDGASWQTAGQITAFPMFIPMFHSLIQLSSGRLLLCGYWQTAEPGLGLERTAPTGWGYWKGRRLFMEGHRGASVGICLTFHSDDEGRTWTQGPDDLVWGIFGWFDERGDLNGNGGIVDLYEPTVAETRDGRVLLLARSKTGRLVQSVSRDGGLTWYAAEPTELASSQSPPLLARLPQSGDLLCVWNQVSGDEIRRGFLRGRLSAAVSTDDGLTWQRFRTLELQAGMRPADRVEPEFPIPRNLVGRSPFSHLPDEFAMFTYPNVDVVGDRVFVRYSRMWPVPRDEAGSSSEDEAPRMWPEYDEREAEMRSESVLRVYPVDWFYAS